MSRYLTALGRPAAAGATFGGGRSGVAWQIERIASVAT